MHIRHLPEGHVVKNDAARLPRRTVIRFFYLWHTPLFCAIIFRSFFRDKVLQCPQKIRATLLTSDRKAPPRACPSWKVKPQGLPGKSIGTLFPEKERAAPEEGSGPRRLKKRRQMRTPRLFTTKEAIFSRSLSTSPSCRVRSALRKVMRQVMLRSSPPLGSYTS